MIFNMLIEKNYYDKISKAGWYRFQTMQKNSYFSKSLNGWNVPYIMTISNLIECFQIADPAESFVFILDL